MILRPSWSQTAPRGASSVTEGADFRAWCFLSGSGVAGHGNDELFPGPGLGPGSTGGTSPKGSRRLYSPHGTSDEGPTTHAEGEKHTRPLACRDGGLGHFQVRMKLGDRQVRTEGRGWHQRWFVERVNP